MVLIHVKTVVRDRGIFHVARFDRVAWCVGVGPTAEHAIGDLICRNSARAGITLTRDPAEPFCGQCDTFERPHTVNPDVPTPTTIDLTLLDAEA